VTNDDLLFLMTYDEWDIGETERAAIKAIIAERDALKLDVESLMHQDEVSDREIGRLRAIVEQLESAPVCPFCKKPLTHEIYDWRCEDEECEANENE
jgi:hypothetical protein